MKVLVNTRGAKRLLARHPWVYRSDIVAGPEEAGIAQVHGSRGFLAHALYNPRSEIAVRAFAFEQAMDPGALLLENLRQALTRRKQALSQDPQGGYRLVHSEGDFLPGLILDYYAGHVVMQVGSFALEDLTPKMVSVLLEAVPVKSILAKNDQKSRIQEGLPLEVKPLAGSVPESVWVEEGAVRYQVDLGGGQKTGAFLDQRENRIRMEGFWGDVALDVFGYHGAFALHLAKSFSKVVVVDSSAEALARARENALANGVSNLEAREANAFELLRQEQKKGAKYNLVVLDPPAFAKSKQDLERAYAAYKEVNLRALKLLPRGGILATASCSHHLTEPLFYEMLKDAAADAHQTVRVTEKRGQGWDHPVLINVPETQYLKFALLEVC